MYKSNKKPSNKPLTRAALLSQKGKGVNLNNIKKKATSEPEPTKAKPARPAEKEDMVKIPLSPAKENFQDQEENWFERSKEQEHNFSLAVSEPSRAKGSLINSAKNEDHENQEYGKTSLTTAEDFTHKSASTTHIDKIEPQDRESQEATTTIVPDYFRSNSGDDYVVLDNGGTTLAEIDAGTPNSQEPMGNYLIEHNSEEGN